MVLMSLLLTGQPKWTNASRKNDFELSTEFRVVTAIRHWQNYNQFLWHAYQSLPSRCRNNTQKPETGPVRNRTIGKKQSLTFKN